MNKDVLNAALRLLGRRDHSEKELVNKLRQRKFNSADISPVIEHCLSEGWLDEARFCESYCRRRSDAGYGPQRIRAELSERGIDSYLIEQAFANNGIDWQQALIQCAERRFSAAPKSHEERAKQIRFLIYRGFSYDQVQNMYK
ncbi:regulatory protein RecX [Corallincola platygyrae]|uniref:Regulatory protein RecX n=1 Tax=Corallincola platygyrae TaxID=1193278 RepID=A0ABW4XKW9_9GAMM